MPEAVNGATPITPSSLNTPKNGATSQTQQPVEPKPASAAPSIEEREAALAKREQAYKAEVAKYTAGKSGLGAKLSRLSELEKRAPDLEKKLREREAAEEAERLNPEVGLKRLFGDNWREGVNAFAVNGVPPPNLIAEAMRNQDAKWEARLAERDRLHAEQSQKSRVAEEEESRAIVRDGATAYVEANTKEYPLLARLGSPQRVGAILAARVEAHFREHGVLQTAKEAAEELETELYGFGDAAAESEKYRPKLQEKWKPATMPSSSVGQGSQGATESSTRRTLGNHLTASTSDKAPARTDAERARRATEVYVATRNAKSRG